MVLMRRCAGRSSGHLESSLGRPFIWYIHLPGPDSGDSGNGEREDLGGKSFCASLLSHYSSNESSPPAVTGWEVLRATLPPAIHSDQFNNLGADYWEMNRLCVGGTLVDAKGDWPP